MSPVLIQNLLLTAMGASDAKDHVLPHALWRLLPFNIPVPGFSDQATTFWFTNHLLMMLIAAAVMLLVFVTVGRHYRVSLAGVPVTESVPRGFTSLIEGSLDALRTGVVRPVLGPDTDRFMPFLWTLFFFILINNLLGMVPLDAIFQILFGLEHIGGTATGNINVTAGLALCAFFTFHVFGILEAYRDLVAGRHGVHHDKAEHAEADDHHASGETQRGTKMGPAAAAIVAPLLYLWNFAPHVFKPAPETRIAIKALLWPADVGMWLLLLILEFIGAVVKPFALCMRLFANMIAGHMVIATFLIALPVFEGLTAAYLGKSLVIVMGCVLMSGLELFVAFLQAFIFMFLSTMFLNLAMHPEH